VVTDTAEKTRLAEELQVSLKELTEVQAHLITSAKMATVGTLAQPKRMRLTILYLQSPAVRTC
jgi:hypothetical protein